MLVPLHIRVRQPRSIVLERRGRERLDQQFSVMVHAQTYLRSVNLFDRQVTHIGGYKWSYLNRAR